MRYCSPCSTSSGLPDKFLLYTFRLPTFRFRSLHSRRILMRHTLLGIMIAFRIGNIGTKFSIRSIDVPSPFSTTEYISQYPCVANVLTRNDFSQKRIFVVNLADGMKVCEKFFRPFFFLSWMSHVLFANYKNSH